MTKERIIAVLFLFFVLGMGIAGGYGLIGVWRESWAFGLFATCLVGFFILCAASTFLELEPPMPPEAPACAWCRFARKTNHYAEHECRRHTPIHSEPQLNQGTSSANRQERQWPLVYDDDWCGDFEHRDLTTWKPPT
jgi:hypothetical protein